MDYEKAYNEALERAKELNKTVSGANYEYIFPELKESEDERIRKWLEETIEGMPENSIDFRDVRRIDVLHWLEKQKPISVEHGHINEGFHPLIEEEIDLWIKENKDIHHNDKNIVGVMRDMAYYVSGLTKNLYKQTSVEWSEEDETGWTNTMIMIKECATNHYTKDSTDLVIKWLYSLKQRMGG